LSEALWRRMGYSRKVIEHFTNPRNVGVIEDADVTAKVGSVVCGDLIKLYLKVDDETEVIKDIKFESYGCASNIATTSILTEMVKGKTIGEAKRVSFKDIIRELGGLPKVKYHCAVLSKAGLDAAVLKYEVKKGRRKLDERAAKLLLKGVLDPASGLSVVEAGGIEELRVEGRRVYVKLRYKSGSREAEYVKESIEEAFSDLGVEVDVEAS